MKVIIAHAYAGIGHKKAAEAVDQALRDLGETDVTTVDVLDYSNPFCKLLYPRFYLFLINRASFLWGLLYYFFDLRFIGSFFIPLRRFLHNINAGRFKQFIVYEKPDVVICAHFFPSDVVASLKRKDLFKGRLVTLITDLIPHSFWMVKHSDYFIGAIERTKKDLLRRGIDEKRVKVLGIPCDPVFGVSKDKKKISGQLGIKENFFNVLIMSGGFGTGPIKGIIKSLSALECELRDKVQLIVICGKNKKLFGELDSLKKDLKVKLSVFGYVNNVDEFMEASDCIVTKSGGLTTSEALSKKLPMIIIKPIPGQESRNCKILVGYGTAVRADRVSQVRGYVRDFLEFPEKIFGMKTRMNFLSYPSAARDIAEFVRNIN